jgi:predicted component of type VI protein secretion system
MWEALKKLIQRKDLSKKEKERLVLDECLEEVADEIEAGPQTPQKPLTQEEFEEVFGDEFNESNR